MYATITKLAIAGTAAAAAAVIAASPAHADAETVEELAYIATLDSEHIYYSSEDAAIGLGRAICQGLDAGMSPTAIVATGLEATHGLYSPYEIGYITGASVGAFCPEYASLIT